MFNACIAVSGVASVEILDGPGWVTAVDALSGAFLLVREFGATVTIRALDSERRPVGEDLVVRP